jgi:hypothetical protein
MILFIYKVEEVLEHICEYSQPLHIPIADTNTSKSLPWSTQTQHLMDMTKLLNDTYFHQFSQILDDTIYLQPKGSS